MTYQVLARKWRPKNFSTFIGQDNVIKSILNSLNSNRLHHAYLFSGNRGVGKTTLSRLLAKAINCTKGITSSPCGSCYACKSIDDGCFIDYIEMDAASNRGIDEMIALIERSSYAPVNARFKIYMIDEVHMLTTYAFNAMLKTLEEPPKYLKFILATTDSKKIPITIISRCLQFNLQQISIDNIVLNLSKIFISEKIKFDIKSINLIARASEGSMRDALSLADQAISYSDGQITEKSIYKMLGKIGSEYLIKIIDSLISKDAIAIIEISNIMLSNNLSFSSALKDLASLFHHIAWVKVEPESGIKEWPEFNNIKRFANILSNELIQLFYQISIIGRNELKLAPDEYSGFTMTLLRMLSFRPSSAFIKDELKSNNEKISRISFIDNADFS